MVRIFYIAALIIPLNFLLPAQELIENHYVDWSKAGLENFKYDKNNRLNIIDFGGDPTGINSNNEAVEEAMNALNGQFGILYFPEGNYFFDETIYLRDSIFLEGQGANNTTLHFDLGGQGNLISLKGKIAASYALTRDALKNEGRIRISANHNLVNGSYIRIFQEDDHLVTSDWAVHSTGQVIKVRSVADDLILLSDSLRLDYPLSHQPKVELITPLVNAGINCLSIIRNDITAGQTSHIAINYGVNCLIQGIESTTSNFAHLAISYSTHIKVQGCYFHHGFGYGDGGKAYGIVTQFSTTNSLIENNIFAHLRHAILVQAGANGNIFSYNFSTDPYWENLFSPPNATGDLVLHGNYPYLNIFESNIVQNIVIDDSHGINGPFNIFLRNRAELYGFTMFNNPPTDDQILIGNEIVNPDEGLGKYIIHGERHVEYGNQVKGLILPEHVNDLPYISFYLSEKPAFMVNHVWPSIGVPLEANEFSIASFTRFHGQTDLTRCEENSHTITEIKYPQIDGNQLHIYPNPSNGWYTLEGNGGIIHKNTTIMIYNFQGKKVWHGMILGQRMHINLETLPKGIYFLVAKGGGQELISKKLILH